MRRFNRLLSPLLLFLLVGCGQDDPQQTSEPSNFADYGQLPFLSKTHHLGLQQELARLTSERATPALLDAEVIRMVSTASSNSSVEIADKDNVAAGLKLICKPQALKFLEKKIAHLIPTDKFQFSREELRKVVHFRSQHEFKRTLFREALARPQCDFGMHLTDGLSADTSFVELGRFCNRLEALMTAELIDAGQLDPAIDSLGFIFRMIALTAAQKHVVPRLSAVWQREEALRVLAAIAQHRDAKRATLDQLLELVNGQLANWPPDALAWSADRAVSMHTYEFIRDGYFLSVITEEEIKLFDDDASVERLIRTPMIAIDEDELYYLNTMRIIIDNCSNPFYKRKPVFQGIRKHLESIRDSAEFPFIAGQILLKDLERGHEIQARDRALCEAWVLALSAATGRKHPGYNINPLTGRPYLVDVQQSRVVVSQIFAEDESHTIVVPLMSGQEQ